MRVTSCRLSTKRLCPHGPYVKGSFHGGSDAPEPVQARCSTHSGTQAHHKRAILAADHDAMTPTKYVARFKTYSVSPFAFTTSRGQARQPNPRPQGSGEELGSSR